MSEALISVGSVNWQLDPEIHPTHFCVDVRARLDVPITVSLAGHTISETLYFALQPTIDPRVRLSGSALELDIARCPWYFGFTPPPQDLQANGGLDDAEKKKRSEFLTEVVKAAGDELRSFLADLRALPGKIFAALREELPKLLDHVLGFLRHIGSAEQYIKDCLESIIHAVEHKVRKAIEWTISLGREVAHRLLTAADQLHGLAVDVCCAVVQSTLVLYEGVLEGSGQLAALLQESFAVMAKDAARFAEQARAMVGSLVQETILRTKTFAADVEGHIAAGIAAVVKAEGFAEAKLNQFMDAVALGIADGAARVKKAAREIADFMPRLIETTTAALHQISNDPSVLYDWIAKLVRMGVKAYAPMAKDAVKWLIMAANALGRGARSLAASVEDFAKKTVAELEPYVKAVMDEWADLAKQLGKASREVFAGFLQRLAGWKRSLFHAACRVLQGAEDLLTAIIGPEHVAEIKAALKFICTFLDDVALKAGQAIDSLYQIGRALAVDLPRDLAKAGEVFHAWIGQQTHSLSAGLKKAFHFLVLEIGGAIQHSPLVQTLIAIINGILTVAKAIGVFIAEKGRQLGDWLRPKITQALARLEDMARSIEAFMEGTGDGCVLEARFRRLSVALPKPSKRSQAKVKLLDGMPSDHKLTGDDVLLPALQALAGEAGIELGALELFTFNDWRFAAPHPVTGFTGVQAPEPAKTRFLPVPLAPDQDMVFRVCMRPRMWVIDPRYSWGYGASNQLRLADIDGDGKVDDWEAYKEADKRRAAAKEPDGDPFTAADRQMLLDQAKNVLNGVPYREIGAPFGLLATYEGGSWLWFAVASIGDEDVGSGVQNDKADPKASVGSLLNVSASGTLLPSGQKVDRTGLGLFWQGMHAFGPNKYPIQYHVEKRFFWDQFASGFGNPGTSTFVVLRGGHNDFQLRGELYQDFTLKPLGSGMGLPVGMYTPTIKATFGLSANGGAALAGAGGFRLGLEYASSSPVAVLLGDEVKDEKKNEGIVDKVLAKLKEDFQVEEIVPTLQKLLTPVLRLVMFDREFEAKLACAGAIAIGDKLAITQKRDWAKQSEGRRRTLRVLEHAETFFADWKFSEGVRRKEADICAGPVPKTPKASEQLLDRVKAVWANDGFHEEQRKDITEIRQLHRAFMRFAIKQPTAADQDLDKKFAEWLDSSGESFRLAKFEAWLADQRQTHYLDKAGTAALALKKMLWAGDVTGAWQKIQGAISKIEATPVEYADEICEAIVALASLVDIFYRMAVALGNLNGGLKKKIGDDLKKQRDERDKKAAERAKPDYKYKSTILGRLGEQAHDDKFAHEVLEDSAKWEKEDTGLADGLSLVWSIDGGIGVGVGGSAGGAGLGAFALLGLSITPPSFKLPSELMKKLSSKLMLVRFGSKFLRAIFEVIEYAVAHPKDLPKDPGGMIRQGIAWLVQAVHQVLVEVLTPGAAPVIDGAAAPDPKAGRGPDPLEDWLYSFLAGSVISVGAKVEGVAKAVGAVAAAEARAGLSGELSVTLASLLDPFIEALQRDAHRDPSEKGSLSVRTIPKISAKVKQSASGAVAFGPAQLDVGITGQSLVADLIFPDGSPWRRAIEADLSSLINDAVKATKKRPAAVAEHKQEGGFLHGMAALCDAVDKLLRVEISAVQDWETKRGGDKPKGVYTSLVTNPAVQHMFAALRDPAFGKAREQKRQRIDELTDLILTKELHFQTYPDTPGIGVKATSAAQASFDVCVLLPDAEVEQFSPKDKVLLAHGVYRIPLSPPPAHVALDTFRKKSDPKGDPLQGFVVGFAKKADAEAFAKQRDGSWVESAVASLPPWASSRSTGGAQWYHWLNTKLFGDIEDLRGKGKRIDQPKMSVDAKGIVLDFGLVDRGLLDKAPFSTYGLVKDSEILFTEAKILTGVWEDDVTRLRSAVAASIERKGQPEPKPDAAPEPAAPADEEKDNEKPAAPSDTVAYSVRRAQAAVNHQLRSPGGISGWTKPLVPDGHFGSKSGGALNAWAKMLGDVSVKGEPGASSLEVGRKLAAVLSDAHDEAVISFAAPHKIPEDDAPWMAIARGEIGQAEVKGAGDNPRIREYHAATTLGEQHDEVAWCSSFVNWSLAKAGVHGTRSAAAASWTGWGGQSDPRRGAIVVLYNAAMANSALSRSGNHVGFLVEDVGWGWKLLGGNQHDMVQEMCFSKKKWTLKAVRWPA